MTAAPLVKARIRFTFETILHRKTRSTAARGRSVGILEGKPPGIQSVMVIDRGVHQIHAVTFVHVNRNAAGLELLIVLALLVESELVAHTRTAAAFRTDPETVAFGDIFRADDLLDFLGGPFGEDHGRFRSSGCLGISNAHATTEIL